MKASRRRRLLQEIYRRKREARRTPILTLQQERTLLERAREGDVWAGQLLVTHSYRYVLNFVGRYFYIIRDECEYDDLIQAGCLGIAEAVADYDHEKGGPFISHAKWHVLSAVSEALNSMHQVIDVPYDVRKDLLDGEPPSSNRRARTLELGRRALRVRLRDKDYFDRCIAWYEDHIEVADIKLDRLFRGLWLYDMLRTLPERDAAIVVMRYGLGNKDTMTLEEIGKIFKLTRERIRSLEARGVRKLQGKMFRMSPREKEKLGEIGCKID